MSYTTIATKADGDILTASYLNTLSDNAEFLYGIANRANVPMCTLRVSATDVDNSDAIWYFRHKLRYLHYKISCAANPDHVRVFYAATSYYAASVLTGTSYTGYIDLNTLANLPKLLGAWVTATSYDNNSNGDGDVVTRSGVYYKCTVDHTSGASTEPGVGGSWATVWEVLNVPGLNTFHSCWVEVGGYGSPQTITVEYLVESDSTSI